MADERKTEVYTDTQGRQQSRETQNYGSAGQSISDALDPEKRRKQLSALAAAAERRAQASPPPTPTPTPNLTPEEERQKALEGLKARQRQ